MWTNVKRLATVPNRAIQRYREYRCDQRLAGMLQKLDMLSPERLRDVDTVADLVRGVGLVRDDRSIYGSDNRYMNPIPRGMWQVPRQLAEFLVLASRYRLRTYIEIGIHTAYTFAFVTRYLARFNPKIEAVAVDLDQSISFRPPQTRNLDLEFAIGTSEDFRNRDFDLCLIDGDHSYSGVSRDYENVGRSAGICAFHDINDELVRTFPDNDGGVPRFWRELRSSYPSDSVYEFQYHSEQRPVMGIGVIIKTRLI
jgi:hypothetical protein